MQAMQFGITKKPKQPQQQAKKIVKPSYRAIDGKLFGGRQVYLDAKNQKGYFAAGTSTFVLITPTRYHMIAGELFCERQTYLDPTGERGFFDPKTNAFHQPTAAEMRRLTGMFRKPLYVVETPSKPTGHQVSKGKKNGEKQKKAA